MVERDAKIVHANQLQELIGAIVRRGYEIIGPVVRNGAVVYERVESVADLPAGWADEQGPGSYRLKRSDDRALFGFASGPQSWKQFLHPADVKLWTAEREGETFRILNNERPRRKPYAFFGVHACDLAAIAVQDRVLIGDKFRDPIYGARREGVFIIAVQCTRSSATCFCSSMGTGPQVREGFDVMLTELDAAGNHRFVIEAGSDRGAEVLAELPTHPAGEADLRQVDAAVESAAYQQVRSIDNSGIKELLYENSDHPRWDDVAGRCLTCANCTMVCPTCFCTTVEDVSDVSGDHAERWRRLDSCFTLAFSFVHEGTVRSSAKGRYRQWMTHKLASWIDQFGTSGCVGCGRCITWCPVGIDLTEEVRAIRQTAGKRVGLEY